MKFRLGEEVKVVSTDFRGVLYYNEESMKGVGETGFIKVYDENADDYQLEDGFWFPSFCLELVQPRIEEGDKIKLRMDATMDDLIKGDWNGCQMDTLAFIKEGDLKKEYVVTHMIGKTPVVRVDGVERVVNPRVVDVIKATKKDMTIREIEKALGHKVKIVKER